MLATRILASGSILMACLSVACAVQAQRIATLAPTGASEPRVALVIGNAKYADSPLANPVNDANDVAEALRPLGFKVILVRDGTTRDMRQAIRELASELRRAKVGLFYFAGHGVQIRGNNYLIPVGAVIDSEADVEDLAIDANYVLRTMEEAQVEVSIAILDACRNNPFARSFRSASRGLAQMTAAKGTVIAFSTAPGSVAADGSGRNGTYTKHLLQNLRHSDTDILKVFQRTRAGVMSETAGRQLPWESTSLVGDFYFRPQGGAPQVALAAPPPLAEKPHKVLADRGLDSPTFLEDLEAFMKDEKAPVLELRRLAQAGEPLATARLCALGTHERFNVGIRADEAVSLCRQLADKGEGLGLYLYGRAFMLGRGVPRDAVEAVRLFRSGMEKGSPLSVNGLASMHFTGQGVPQNPSEAFRLFRQAAESGVPLAMTNVGRAYLLGQGVARDHQEGIRWLQKATEMRDPLGMATLGLAYFEGRGVPKDAAEAIRWYRRGADSGLPYAMALLGVAYVNGFGVAKNVAEAAYWLQRAHEGGDLNGTFNLGYLHETGQGVQRNPAEAARLYRIVADAGFAQAMLNLATLTRQGIGVAKDEAEALRLLHAAADKGYGDAMLQLGILHENGESVRRNHEEAVKWYRKAADTGNGFAMSALGYMYMEGKGVARDDQEAVRLFKAAAEIEIPAGMLNLGTMYARGRGGLPEDKERAAFWYRKAAASGDERVKALAESNLRGGGR